MTHLTTCPACNSTLRNGDDGLEVVSIAKPGERWRPLVRKPRQLGEDYFVAVGIITQVARGHGFTLSEVRSPQRHGPLVEARIEAAQAAHQQTEISISAIGRILNRDHSTVMYYLRAPEMKEPALHWADRTGGSSGC